MTKNPYINALIAALYIVVVANMMFFGEKLVAVEETILIPIAVLSLFVFSAAFMGTAFFLQPAQMYLAGMKKEAVSLFVKTLATFAVITVAFFAVMVLFM